MSKRYFVSVAYKMYRVKRERNQVCFEALAKAGSWLNLDCEFAVFEDRNGGYGYCLQYVAKTKKGAINTAHRFRKLLNDSKHTGRVSIHGSDGFELNVR